MLHKLLSLLIALGFCANVQGADMVYYNMSSFPLLGTVVHGGKTQYTRLPDSLSKVCRPPLWDLGYNTAGMSIRFASNSTKIAAKWNSRNTFSMNHMTPVGIRGLDLYALQDDGTWTFVNSARPRLNKKTSETTIISDMIPKMREYMLFLPLYDGIDSLYIGVDSLSSVMMPMSPTPVRAKPIVFYGTSITQGGCANRPAMCHTNILQRWLNREVYNLGFSGNGQLDYEIADLMGNIDAGMYILEFLPNVTYDQMNERMDKFYKILRAKRPNVPILFVETPPFPHRRFNQEVFKKVSQKDACLNAYFKELKHRGEKNIYYLRSTKQLGDDNEATVDGNHFTDLGFERYSKVLYPIIKQHALK